MSLFVLSGYIPSSSLNTVLRVVLEHPINSTFLAAVVCTVSSCFTNFAFPSHTCPAYSSFGTIAFIKIHILILVSRCESVRIASILPTCVLPFPTYHFCYVCIPRAFFLDLYAKVRMTVCDRQLIFSLLPFESYRVLLILATYKVQLLRTFFTFAVALHFLVYSIIVPSLFVFAILRCF